MVVMYNFCFWFSVRLGSIIVGAVSLVQAIGGLVVCCLAVSHPQAVTSLIGWVHDDYELLFVGDLLEAVKKDPGGASTTATVLMGAYTLSCLLLIVAAFKCNWQLALPYVGLDLARLAFTTGVFIVVVMIVKENILDLGAIIGATIIGGFVLLYLFYMWFCTVSFCQMVREVQRSDGERALIATNIKPMPWKQQLGLQMTDFRADYRTNYRSKLALPRPAY